MSQFLNGIAVFGLLVVMPIAGIAAVEYAVDTYCNSLPPTPHHSLSKTEQFVHDSELGISRCKNCQQ